MTVNGKRIVRVGQLKRADFLRKTNYYWFAMMFKLLDPGLRYTRLPARRVDGVDYELVKVTFDAGVGDAQDTYLLYINKRTHLVDRFLFTVMDFGRKKPLLMKVRYTEVNGLKLPTHRQYTPSDWQGRVPKRAKWTTEISRDITFNNQFGREQFALPKKRGATP